MFAGLARGARPHYDHSVARARVAKTPSLGGQAVPSGAGSMLD